MFSIEMSRTQTFGAILNSMIWSTHLVFHSHLCVNNFGAILIPQLFTIIDSRNVCFKRGARLGFYQKSSTWWPKKPRFFPEVHVVPTCWTSHRSSSISPLLAGSAHLQGVPKFSLGAQHLDRKGVLQGSSWVHSPKLTAHGPWKMLLFFEMPKLENYRRDANKWTWAACDHHDNQKRRPLWM